MTEQEKKEAYYYEQIEKQKASHPSKSKQPVINLATDNKELLHQANQAEYNAQP